MTARTHREARTLFVLSKDYGELAMAMLFLHGQELATRAVLMLPEPVYGANKDSLPASTSLYATLQDILGVVDSHEPDLVFLFSGYLLSHDRLLSPPSLEVLVRRLRERGCGVVTSDPFVGLASHLTLSQLDSRMLVSRRPLPVRWIVRLGVHLLARHRRIVRVPILEHVIHVYPTSTLARGSENGVRSASFFNPNIVLPADESWGPSDRGSAKNWLFVLSSTELEVQHQLLGTRAFTRVVAHLLHQALDAGRRPTLIGPPSIVEILRRGLPADRDLEVISFCSHVDFVARLLEAEYVFYWNVFTCSLFQRLANERPVFFFDRGHVSRTIEPFYQVALSFHFGNWMPTYLDQRRQLDPRALAELAEQQKPAMRAVRERWQASPTPAQLVDELLRDRGIR